MEKLDLAELAKEGRSVVERVHELSEEAIRIAQSGSRKDIVEYLNEFEWGIAPCVELFREAVKADNKEVMTYVASRTLAIECPKLLKWAIWENHAEMVEWLIEECEISDKEVKEVLLEVVNEKYIPREEKELKFLGGK